MRRIPVGAVVAAAAVLVGCHSITEELPTEPTGPRKPHRGGPGGGPGGGRSHGGDTRALRGRRLDANADCHSGADLHSGARAGSTFGDNASAGGDARARATAAGTDPGARPPALGRRRQRRGVRQSPPPAVSKVKAKVHIKGANKYTLDATPLVGAASTARRSASPTGESGARSVRKGTRSATRARPMPWARQRTTAAPAPPGPATPATARATPARITRTTSTCCGPTRSGFYEACVKDGTCGSVDVSR